MVEINTRTDVRRAAIRYVQMTAPQKFSDPNAVCLVELRSTGQQTLAPPSVHPSGEALRWEKGGEAQEIESTKMTNRIIQENNFFSALENGVFRVRSLPRLNSFVPAPGGIQ